MIPWRLGTKTTTEHSLDHLVQPQVASFFHTCFAIMQKFMHMDELLTVVESRNADQLEKLLSDGREEAMRLKLFNDRMKLLFHAFHGRHVLGDALRCHGHISH